jgi:transposase-like protein
MQSAMVPMDSASPALSPDEQEQLERLAASTTAEFRLHQRAEMILRAASGASIREIARQGKLSRNTVRKWLRRYPHRRRENPDKSVSSWLADANRVGRPDTFSEFFWIDVMTLATSLPEDSGRPITHWTQRELADEVVERDWAPSISHTSIGRFLRRCQLKPHQVEGWMNRKEDPKFASHACDVRAQLEEATSGKRIEPNEVTVSFDEKTGIQATERIAPDQPMKPGRPVRQEFEYQRHGTLVLFAMMIITSGELITCTSHNRTNEKTADVLSSMFVELFERGYRRIDVILDQLNTHWSADLVMAIAALCGMPDPIQEGMSNGCERRFWLTSPHHRIVLHFTPKHASWLNPIEIWFGVLAGKVLRRGSFRSTGDLADRIRRFVAYYNRKLSRPYRFGHWTAQG